LSDGEHNKEVFRRYGEEAWGRGNLAVLQDLLTDDFVGHTGLRNRDRQQLAEDIRAYRERHPDMTFEIVDQLAAGDRVATRLIARSGERVATGLNISRFAERRLAEEWAVWTDFEPE
jgi:predicted SnoaL-like aldol condensation-catalyzing enzyme